jgi:hypothetical protein
MMSTEIVPVSGAGYLAGSSALQMRTEIVPVSGAALDVKQEEHCSSPKKTRGMLTVSYSAPAAPLTINVDAVTTKRGTLLLSPPPSPTWPQQTITSSTPHHVRTIEKARQLNPSWSVKTSLEQDPSAQQINSVAGVAPATLPPLSRRLARYPYPSQSTTISESKTVADCLVKLKSIVPLTANDVWEFWRTSYAVSDRVAKAQATEEDLEFQKCIASYVPNLSVSAPTTTTTTHIWPRSRN